jgi:hypothetical protein
MPKESMARRYTGCSTHPKPRGGEPRPRERSAKPGLVSRLRDCLWGRRPEVELGEEERTYRITIYPPGPGVKIAELWHYFRERWKEFVFYVVVGVAVVVVGTLLGLD